MTRPSGRRRHTNRNVAGFPLSPQMSKADRMHMERVITSVLMAAVQQNRIHGIYRSLTPGHPQHLTPREHRDLVKNTGAMFDATIRATEDQEGCVSDWPYGRGCFISVDGSMVRSRSQAVYTCCEFSFIPRFPSTSCQDEMACLSRFV